MSVPISYISITGGSETWIIATEFVSSVSERKNSILLTATDGLFTVGENDAEAVERTYSSGSVLPPSPRFAGKDISLDFLIFSRGNSTVDIKQIYKDFEAVLKSDSLTVSTDFPHTLTCQLQRIDWVAEDWKGSGRLSFRVFLKASQA